MTMNVQSLVVNVNLIKESLDSVKASPKECAVSTRSPISAEDCIAWGMDPPYLKPAQGYKFKRKHQNMISSPDDPRE